MALRVLCEAVGPASEDLLIYGKECLLKCFTVHAFNEFLSFWKNARYVFSSELRNFSTIVPVEDGKERRIWVIDELQQGDMCIFHVPPPTLHGTATECISAALL
mmetsp:Transcript_145147/g.251269  ORF Transcript_145147/g.251269 Transcript_145147/m.251269 type:complete len:104 (+) Transcript_145147:1964-2275(+)